MKESNSLRKEFISVDIVPKTTEIKEYIYDQEIGGEIKTEDSLTYTHIKQLIKDKYKKIEDEEELIELINATYYEKIALESISPESLIIGGISILSLLISIITILLTIIDKIYNIGDIPAFFILIVIILAFIYFLTFLLSYKLKEKSKLMVYYTLKLDALCELIGEISFKSADESKKVRRTPVPCPTKTKGNK